MLTAEPNLVARRARRRWRWARAWWSPSAASTAPLLFTDGRRRSRSRACRSRRSATRPAPATASPAASSATSTPSASTAAHDDRGAAPGDGLRLGDGLVQRRGLRHRAASPRSTAAEIAERLDGVQAPDRLRGRRASAPSRGSADRSGALVAVEAAVRIDERCAEAAVVGRGGRTPGDLGSACAPVGGVALLDRLEHPLAPGLGAVGPSQPLSRTANSSPPIRADVVAGAGRAVEDRSRSERSSESPARVSVVVVDDLEAVEVEERDRDRGAVAGELDLGMRSAPRPSRRGCRAR